ncbi:MAG: hypothetical protein K0S27_963 [Gammaproteobacteria bacterium]|jgi:hypothetical protein|nr:hypothetical protein [Gammaproteobacteria bacterium]
MKQKIIKMLISSIYFGILSFSFGAAGASAATDQQMQKISQMEHQLSELQREIVILKKQTQFKHPLSLKTHKKSRVASSPNTAYSPSQIEGPTNLPQGGPLYLPVDFDVPGQSFVSSGPYIGIPLQYSGSNLIVNSPSVNEDVILLKLRKNIIQRLQAYGRPEEAHGSHILLSGAIQGQALFTNHGGGSNNQSDINLTTAALDAYVLGPSTWTSGLLELNYDNNIGTQTGSFSSNNRTQNSRVFVNKAFVVIGDFLQSPWYASFGQMFVPFGTYASTLVSDPLTKTLGRIQARAIVLGYKQQSENNLYASAYIFKGASHASATSRINNGGINVGYGFKMQQVNADIGGGVVANIADSQGMQFTGNQPLFAGFGGPTVDNVVTTTGNTASVVTVNTGNEKLVHRVPAYDARALLGFGDNIQVIGEYILASTNFNPTDMTFNSHGARPQVLNIEGIYNIPWFAKHTSVTIAYGMSKNALAIGLPAQRYSFVINQSWWRDTLQSLEFRRDVNYSGSSTSSGSGIAGPAGSSQPVNMLTLQFSYFF